LTKWTGAGAFAVLGGVMRTTGGCAPGGRWIVVSNSDGSSRLTEW